MATAVPSSAIRDAGVVAAALGAGRDAVLAAAAGATVARFTLDEACDVAVREPGAVDPEWSGCVVARDEAPFRDVVRDAGAATTADRAVEVVVDSGGAITADLTAARLAPHASRSWGDAVAALLAAAAVAPATPVGRLPLLGPDAAARRAAEPNARAARARPARLVHSAFEACAREAPDRTALAAADRSVTYGDLAAAADRFAGRLAGLGLGPDDPIGIQADRSVAQVVAMLGALRRGVPFVPLDQRLPAERIRAVLRSAGARAVATQRHLVGGLAGTGLPLLVDDDGLGEPAAGGPPVLPGHAAWVYFTSGSTGVPKGVVIDHRCATTRVDWIVERYGLGPGDVVLHKTPLIFDVALVEVLAPLSVGATVLLSDPGGEAEVDHLRDLLDRHPVTFVHFVPSMLKAFLDGVGDATFPGVRYLQTSGEAMPARLAEAAMAHFPDAEVHSAYGQTETSEVAAWEGGPLDGTAVVPVGEQVGVFRMFLLDDALWPVPDGVPGEICVAGVGGLARGYHGDPALTADRFVPHPFPVVPGERLYRTGDLAARDGSGRLLFLGRRDTQTKIRGARVEPAEVEAAVASAPGVRDCAVVVRPDERGDNELVAYVVGTGVAVDDLVAHAAASLPTYMLPAAYVTLDRLPITPSGKLDRVALPEPGPANRVAAAAPEPPEPGLEAELAALWAAILGVPSVGRTDNFFALGGNSLKAIQVLNRVATRFDTRVTAGEFFASPTVAALAEAIGGHLLALASAMSDDDAALLEVLER